MSSSAPVAVLGATGNQGGAVVDALLDLGTPVRALVRKTDDDKARALADRGVELVVADQEDTDAVARALDGVATLSMMTTFAGADATEGEVRRGRNVVAAAVRAAVDWVVYSSVGGAERRTEIPHFESKRRVEEALDASGLPHAFVRPTFFYENLAGQLPQAGQPFTLRLPIPPDVSLEMVAVRDIGRTVAQVVTDPDALPVGPDSTRAVEIAGDELTMQQAAAAISEVFEVTGSYAELPLDALGNADQEQMFAWFATLPAYTADFVATRELAGDPLTFRAWLEQQRG